MIHLYSIKNSPRLQYVADVIFKTILRSPYCIIEVADYQSFKNLTQPHIPSILYGIPSGEYVSIPAEALLFETGISPQKLEIRKGSPPKLLFSALASSGYSIDFDIFSVAFYLLSEYYYYAEGQADEHGRYMEKSHPLSASGFAGQPLVDDYANLLWQHLTTFYPDIGKEENCFDYEITFDIDNPYLYKYKNAFLQAGSLVKNLVKLQWQNFLHQVKTLSGARDPYDVYAEIMHTIPASKLLFFFLIERNHKNDGRHTYRTGAYRKLIKKISDAGIRTGIHPSYTSSLNGGRIAFETRTLQNITGVPVIHSRMHFLKYTLPQTFEALQQAGILHDYTLCPLADTGFRNFVSRPVNWFNLAANQATVLTLHPTLAMDRSLQKYMELNPEEAWQAIRKMIDTTRKYNGIFTILFHNNSLSETGEWTGWKKVFYKTFAYLAEKKAIDIHTGA